MDCSLTPIIFNSIHIQNSEKYIFQLKNGCKHYKIVGVCSERYVESKKSIDCSLKYVQKLLLGESFVAFILLNWS